MFQYNIQTPTFHLAPSSTSGGSSRQSPEGNQSDSLTGKRALIVEDEFFVALEVEEAVQSFGCEAIGPFLNLEKALAAAEREEFDFAILDINLDSTMVFPLADKLIERDVPFVFVTGYAENDLPEEYRLQIRVQKPFAFFELRKALEERLSWINPSRS